uniref:Uncharacterized protein n=1 Tax=viral metagenome TaxID=1070528 RepID=A0A6M3KG10_9ZZZZ
MIKNFNDLLAVLLGVGVIPIIWTLQGLGLVTLPGEILGATIAGETLIIQYYFRRQPPTNGGGT